MGFLQDTLSIMKKRNLSLVESFQESGDVYTFRFEHEKDYTWRAGQYALFSITHKKIKNGTRPFSLASAPVENRVQITTHIRDNPSEFKQALLELKPGMTIKASGPVGSFHLQDNRPSLLIAGGIGITPFRSIVKQLEAEGKGGNKPIHLLYMASGKSHLFQDELDALADRSSVSVTYLDSRNDLQREIDKFAATYKNEGAYLIAGAKSMVDSVAELLHKNDVAKQNIKKDAFFGYS